MQPCSRNWTLRLLNRYHTVFSNPEPLKSCLPRRLLRNQNLLSQTFQVLYNCKLDGKGLMDMPSAALRITPAQTKATFDPSSYSIPLCTSNSLLHLNSSNAAFATVSKLNSELLAVRVRSSWQLQLLSTLLLKPPPMQLPCLTFSPAF